MENTELDVPCVTAENDFTIIYKGREEREGQILENIEEIKTSKEEFLHKLRYFKQKSHEIDEQDEIFIHDIYPVEIFKEFISTLTTNKINLNESNYKSIKKLSNKYGYKELSRVVDNFISSRPDIDHIIEEYLTDEIDEDKEEQIAAHLDICLLNSHMLTFPIEKLNRILNSPKRVLKNHHLLFNFIKKIIEKVKISGHKSDNTNNDEENIQILMSSLDYRQMSKDEMKEFFESPNFSTVFNCRGTKEMMNTLLKDNDHKEERLNSLEEQIRQLNNLIETKICIFEKLSTQKENEINKQINDQKQKISEYEKEMKKQQKCIDDQKIKINELEKIIKKNNSDFEKWNQNQQKIIENQEIKINKLVEENQIKIINEQEKQQKYIESQSTKINDIEKRINLLIPKKLKGKISLNILSDQTIKGIIDTTELGAKMDSKRSKYILNTSNAATLGRKSYDNGNSIENLKQEMTFMKKAGTYYLHALLVDIFDQEKEIVSEPVTTKGTILNYGFTGRVQAAVLDEGTYILEVWGAEGGKNDQFAKSPGKGGYSVGTLTLQKKTKLFIHVGESPSSEKGGWNGGGNGSKFVDGFFGAGGGGCTDISLYGEEGTMNWNNENHLFSRIIVAGAGGGSSSNGRTDWYGGFGGGVSGQKTGHSKTKENEGTQTRAGVSNSHSEGQGFGTGGNHTGNGSSGGGSGWYGGGAANEATNCAGGSGGSGYVYNSSTASNYPKGCKLNSSFFLTNSKTESGDQQIPNPLNSSTEKGHSGHGYARITFQ